MFVTLILLCGIDNSKDIIYKVDLIEYNIVISIDGNFVLDQFIFYKWMYNSKIGRYRYDIVDWRLSKIRKNENLEEKQRAFAREWLKTNKEPVPVLWQEIEQWPISCENGYVYTFHDPKDKFKLKQIHSKLYRESITCYDLELIEREYLPENQRLKLIKISK